VRKGTTPDRIEAAVRELLIERPRRKRQLRSRAGAEHESRSSTANGAARSRTGCAVSGDTTPRGCSSSPMSRGANGFDAHVSIAAEGEPAPGQLALLHETIVVEIGDRHLDDLFFGTPRSAKLPRPPALLRRRCSRARRAVRAPAHRRGRATARRGIARHRAAGRDLAAPFAVDGTRSMFQAPARTKLSFSAWRSMSSSPPPLRSCSGVVPSSLQTASLLSIRSRPVLALGGAVARPPSVPASPPDIWAAAPASVGWLDAQDLTIGSQIRHWPSTSSCA